MQGPLSINLVKSMHHIPAKTIEVLKASVVVTRKNIRIGRLDLLSRATGCTCYIYAGHLQPGCV